MDRDALANMDLLANKDLPATKDVPDQARALALTAAMVDIHRRGWCDGTGGNFSCVLDRDPLCLLMAPSGVDKGSVQPDDLIQVNQRGQVTHGSGKASAETLLHLAIVEATGAGAVLHTHSQAGTVLSSHFNPPVPLPSSNAESEAAATTGNSSGFPAHNPPLRTTPSESEKVRFLTLSDLEMIKGLEGITSHTAVVRVPILSNHQNMAYLSEVATPFLPDAPHGVLIAGHGLYAWGSDLTKARRHLEILEFLLEQRWRQLLLDLLMARNSHDPIRRSHTP